MIEPSSSSCPLASTVGIISTTSLRLDGRPPRPTGPLLEKGYVVPFLIALKTRSASLDDSRRFPTHWLYGGSLPDDLVWAAPETFPAFRQHSFPTCRHPYAGRRAGSICPVFPQPQWPSPLLNWVGSCIYPDTDFRRGILTTLQCSLYAVARRVASPPGSVRPNADALAAEDIYTRACPRGDRSPPESGMTTQHPRTDTVAGLPPAGALPLQAALNSRLDPCRPVPTRARPVPQT